MYSDSEYWGIIGLLRFFIESGRYSIVDRIANATSPAAIKASLYEALRIANSLKARSIRIALRTKTSQGEEKTYQLQCCEYGEELGYGIQGVVEGLLEGPEDLKGARIYCIPCPPIPSEEELRGFLEKISKDVSIAKEVAILAHAYRPSKS